MSYSLDKLYKIAGRDDKVITLTFYPESKAIQLFGNEITVLFLYDQFVREKLEANHLKGLDDGTTGLVKARCLVCDNTSKEGKELLAKEGVNSAEILSTFGGFFPSKNTFYKKEKREIQKMTIRTKALPKGGDHDWIYGMKKRFIQSNIGLSPYDRAGFLASKKFYDEDQITKEELSEMYDGDVLKPEIEVKYLDIKYDKEIINEEEEKRLFDLWKLLADKNFEILKEELNNAGTSVLKLTQENYPLLYHLVQGTYKFIPETLNMGKRPVYIDFRSYLHVFLRHVPEFNIGNQYDGKTKFLWNPQDVIPVMKSVIESVEKEIQEFWDNQPGQRFSKYGAQSLYYQGDYYTFHIESDGRLSTFHRSKEKIEGV